MRNKAIFAAILAFVIMVAPSGAETMNEAVSAQNGVQIMLRGKPLPLPVPPVVERGTTLVPLRSIAEALGATVQYRNDGTGEKTITLSHGGYSALLTIRSAEMKVNGKTVQLSVAPRLQGNVTMVPLRAVSESLGAVVSWDSKSRIVRIDDPDGLPVIGTAEKLRELLKHTEQMQYRTFKLETTAVVNQSGAADSAASEAAAAPAAGGDYSATNVQVAGVDEADWAKTDGRFIYQLSGNRIMIADISDPAEPKLAASIDYGSEGFYPQEMYVDEGRLIVIGHYNAPIIADGGAAEQETPAAGSELKTEASKIMAQDARIGIWPPYPVRNTVKTIVYEIDDAGQPKVTRETEIEGNYITSRKVGSALYLVTNKYSYVYPMLEDNAKSMDEAVAAFEPAYRDSAAHGDKLVSIPLADIRYFPGSPDSSLMLIGALDLDRPEEPMHVSSYLGSGQTIYASKSHMYVAVAKSVPDGETYHQETQLYKFGMNQGSVDYIGEGSVPGTVLNQFSMDEHNGYFRIATTSGDMWASGDATSKNNLYVLDGQLKQAGALEGLAPGERIYSARFMGDRAYMVTFRNVDPLFVIDLSKPAEPAVLGKLKIPGYSDYLHPYDENHIIGFGKETIELPSQGMGPDETMAFYQGMKIALFDVTDVNKPVEKFKEVIGDRGTHSDLLFDHKALLFNRDKDLLAFPVQLMEIKDKKTIEPGGFPAYGEMTYQGAYVYRINPQEGFVLRGRITHLSDKDMGALREYGYGYDYGKTVRRIMYVGDTLYTLSERTLKANDLSSLDERGSLAYPAQPGQGYQAEPGVKPLPAPMPVDTLR
ncbi:beta-propeller domain-containing protein [Paenibacillus tarimensis]